jgi:catalase
LQGRAFSYLDTQITRLGGPNFAQLPINQPLAPVNNHNQDGFGRIRNRAGRVNYERNSLNGGSPAPHEASPEQHGYVSYTERIDGAKIRRRSPSFGDHYTQTAMFWHSQPPHEQLHIVEALQFELGKVESVEVRQRMVEHLARVATELAARVAPAIGVAIPTGIEPAKPPRLAPETSIAANATPVTKGRKVAILAADGVDAAAVQAMQTALQGAGALAEVVAPHLGTLSTANGALPVDRGLPTVASVLFDAVYVPGGATSAAALASEGKAVHFVNEAYKHGKPIAATDEGVNVLRAGFLGAPGSIPAPDAAGLEAHGVIIQNGTGDAAAFADRFVQAVSKHRFFDRPLKEGVPA